MLQISSARNGYIVKRLKDSEDEVEPLPIVVEEGDSNLGEMEAAQKLFWVLCDELGINTSRKRPHIRVQVFDENENLIEFD